MFQASKHRKHSVRENDEHTASSGDEKTPNIWEKYRPRAAINFSDLIEELTMDAASPSYTSRDSIKHTFEPSEISGRSTGRVRDKRNREYEVAAAAAKMSIDMILSDSFVNDIRSMSTKHNVDDIEDKASRSSLPTKYMTADSIPMYSTNEMAWNRSCFEPPKVGSISVASDDFAPFDQVCTALYIK